MDDTFRLLAWYLALAVPGVLGLPLARRCLSALPDHGLTFARLVGSLAIATAYGLVSTTGVIAAGWPSAITATVLVAGVVALCLTGTGWAQVKDSWRTHSRVVWISEAIFVAALMAATILRAHHPDIMATGKPEEFALFNGLLRSAVWPPQDPWLAGSVVAQPSFGWAFIVYLTALTGTPSAVGFNLGVATVMALSASGLYAVVANMITSLQAGIISKRGNRSTIGPDDRQSQLWAVLAPVVILLTGNLYGVLALLHANGALADATVVVPSVAAATSEQAGGSGVEWTRQGLWSWLDTQGLVGPPPSPPPERLTLDPGFWWWYEAGRVIHDRSPSGRPMAASLTTMFPALAFILGDLEPQVLALPLELLALGVVLSGTRWAAAATGNGRPIAWLIGAAGTFGALSATNFWSAPIFGGLIVIAPAIGRARTGGWRNAVTTGGREIVIGLAAAALGLAAYSPHLAYLVGRGWQLSANLEFPTRSQQAAIALSPILWLMLIFVLGSTRIGGIALRWRQGIVAAAAMFGGLLALSIGLTALIGANPLQVAGSTLPGDLGPVPTSDVLVLRRMLEPWTTVLLALGLGVCVFGLAGPSRGAVAPGRDRAQTTDRQLPTYALLLVAAACLALLLPEWIYWKDEAGSRAGTLTQLSLQAWILGGVGAWVGLWWIVQGPERSKGSSDTARRPALRLAGVVTTIITALLVAAGLIYTALAAVSISKTDAATLDGMAYFARIYPDDWAASQWLAQRAAPDTVIVEAIGGDDWTTGTYSRVSMATGIPTILGWPGHEAQWRPDNLPNLGRREADVVQLYTTSDPGELLEVLARYNITYVVLGSIEHSTYGIPVDAAILTGACGCLDVAFTQGSLTLLRVVEHDRP